MSEIRSGILRKIVSKHNYSTNSNQPYKKMVRESFYKTNGEFLLVVKDIENCTIDLDLTTTEHIVIKALTKVVVKHTNLIDGVYNELVMDNGSSVELCELEGNYYIIASDGLKFD